jgi:DNA polymerase
MRDLLRDLRSIVEHEKAVYGALLPLDAEDETAPLAEKESSRSTEMTSGSENPTSSAEQDLSSQDPSSSSPDGRAVAEDGSTETPPSSPTDSPDDAPTDPMPNKDLFGNRTHPPEEDPTLPPWKRIDALVPDDAPFKDAETLEEVEQYLADNVLVPIDEDRENPVFGVGDPEADLVIIGEAPGRDEDKEGEPFVGRAGKLLDKILDAINFEREEVYITNILKSRPPRNRNPHQEEIDAHLPILCKQLALIRPEIILAVGKVAGNTLLDRSSSLSNLRDKEHDFYGVPMMVTYHPAALLRNSQWKRPTWEDVKLLRTRYDELTEEAN